MVRTPSEITLIAGTVVAGALLPLQALINGRLGGHLGSPFWAAALQNLVGAACMLGVVAALRPALPSGGQLAGVPPWAWVGGALGMIYVVVALLAAPRLGAGPAMSGIILGQLVSALLLDHFGVLHERRPIDVTAVAGVLLLAAGAGLLLLRRA
jgi:transporter family-2 protein